MTRTFADSDDDTTQLRVRGAFVVLLMFTALAHEFGVDSLLGAFIAGMVVAVSDGDDAAQSGALPGQAARDRLRVPGPGVLRDDRGPVRHPRAVRAPAALALVPLLVLAILVVRGGPALLYRRRLGLRPALAAGLLQATTLTFPVVVAALGLDLGLLSQATAAALIGASLLSVLLFPAGALLLGPWTPGGRKETAGGTAPTGSVVQAD